MGRTSLIVYGPRQPTARPYCVPEKAVDRVDLGRAIRALRREAGLTQEDLASGANLHVTYISEIENGKRNPSFDALGKLVRALGVTWADLAERLDASS